MVILNSFIFIRQMGVGLLLVIVLTGLGCGLRVGERISSQRVNGFSVGCLNGMNEKVDLYMKGRLNVDQVSQLFNCTKIALTIFKERVRGRDKGVFAPDELRKFIQDLILQDKIINDALLEQLIRLKKVIIGGPEDKLTVSDIERFIIFLDVLKEEAVFFQPYIHVLNVPDHEKKEGVEKSLNTIEQDLKKSISRISIFLKNFSEPYMLEDMKILIREMGLFINRYYDVSDLDEKVALFGSLKKFIVGGGNTVVHPNEWADLLVGYSYIISAGVNFLLLRKQEAFISPYGMQYVSTMLKSFMDVLSLSVKNHQKNPLDESMFIELASRLKEAKVVPEKLRKKSMRNLLVILFGKIFNVDKKKYGTIELTDGHLEKMRQLIQPWANIQSFLDYLSSNNSLQEGITDSEKSLSFFPSERINVVWKKFVEQTRELKPLYKEGTKIYLSGELYRADHKSKLDYKNLTIYNFYYFISEMLKYGYEKDYPESSGMVQKELGNFFSDFNPIGEDMGWLTKTEGRALASGEAEFLAANMFTPTAKGFHSDWNKEEYLTLNEIIEYLAYAFSFGFSLKEVNEAVLKFCGEDGEDVSSHSEERRYSIRCVQNHLFPILKNQMSNMPDLQKVMAKMTEEERGALIEALIHISFETKWEYKNTDYLTKDNLKNIVMALYFVETTFNRYDLNGDFILQSDEIWLGFPIFEGYISRILIQLLCRDSNDLAPSVYAYAIEKESLPTSDELTWYKRLQAWLNLQMHSKLRNWMGVEYWDLRLDRGKLTRVFSTVVKGFLAKKRERVSKKCPDPNVSHLRRKQ